MTRFLALRSCALTLGLALALGLAACDSGDDDEGTFDVQIEFSDGTGGTVPGRALFSAGGEDEPFRIELVPRSEQSGFREGIVLARRAPGVPEAGRYEFARPTGDALPPSGFAGAIQISFDGSAPPLYYIESGTLVIDAFSEGRLEGRLLDVRARRVEAGGSSDAPLSLDIRQGRFRAERSDRVRRFPL